MAVPECRGPGRTQRAGLLQHHSAPHGTPEFVHVILFNLVSFNDVLSYFTITTTIIIIIIIIIIIMFYVFVLIPLF
jgi:hypothetical protein